MQSLSFSFIDDENFHQRAFKEAFLRSRRISFAQQIEYESERAEAQKKEKKL